LRDIQVFPGLYLQRWRGARVPARKAALSFPRIGIRRNGAAPRSRRVGFTPESRLNSDIAACPKRANMRLMRCSKIR
jgi:hypothetical protein